MSQPSRHLPNLIRQLSKYPLARIRMTSCQASLFRAITNYGTNQRHRSLCIPCTTNASGCLSVARQGWPKRIASIRNLAAVGHEVVHTIRPSVHSETLWRPDSDPPSTRNPLRSKSFECERARAVLDCGLLRRTNRKLPRNCRFA